MFIENPGLPITENDIQQFEQKHQVRLTGEHKTFLLKFNGGSPYPNSYLAESGVEVVVSRIFSLFDHDLGDLDSLCSEPRWRKALKDGYVEFADDLGGQRIIISTKGDNKGSVFISIDDELYFIAGSFNDFLNRAENMVGLGPPPFHDEWTRIAMDKVTNGTAGIYHLPKKSDSP